MKALPLWQPWAQLVVIGAKRVETRHWPAPNYVVGQRVAIHATKTKDHLFVREADGRFMAAAGGMSQSEAGRRFGVHSSIVCRLVARTIWAHVV